MSDNILSKIPKPLLEKAQKVIKEALEESTEKEHSKRTGKMSLKSASVSRIVHKEIITLNEIITWAKSHCPKEDDVKFVVIKDNSDNLDYDFILYLLYSKNNKPLLGKEYDSMAVYSQKMNESLLETFNNSDIIEFE